MKKIIVLGDSISEGIGSKKVNYTDILKSKINEIEIKNLALTGTTIKYGLDLIEQIVKFNPKYVIIFYGNVDAMPRVNINSKLNLYRFLPKRYKQNGMLNPRALFTSKKPNVYLQKVDSIMRTNLNKILIKIQGYYQWVDIQEFEVLYDLLINKIISSCYDTKIITISTVPMEDRLFPFANIEYKKYNYVIKKLSDKYNLQYIDLFNKLKDVNKDKIFLADKFHPNEQGYYVIAEQIINCLEL